MSNIKIFKPNKTQRLAKSRLHNFLTENAATMSIDKMSITNMSEVSRAGKLAEWLSVPGFPEWFLDKDTINTRVSAYAEIAVEKLYAILDTPMEEVHAKNAVSTKDLLKAAEMVLQLADKFPQKNKVVEKFLDKQLNSMDEEEVQQEIAAMKTKLDI